MAGVGFDFDGDDKALPERSGRWTTGFEFERAQETPSHGFTIGDNFSDSSTEDVEQHGFTIDLTSPDVSTARSQEFAIGAPDVSTATSQEFAIGDPIPLEPRVSGAAASGSSSPYAGGAGFQFEATTEKTHGPHNPDLEWRVGHDCGNLFGKGNMMNFSHQAKILIVNLVYNLVQFSTKLLRSICSELTVILGKTVQSTRGAAYAVAGARCSSKMEGVGLSDAVVAVRSGYKPGWGPAGIALTPPTHRPAHGSPQVHSQESLLFGRTQSFRTRKKILGLWAEARPT